MHDDDEDDDDDDDDDDNAITKYVLHEDGKSSFTPPPQQCLQFCDGMKPFMGAKRQVLNNSVGTSGKRR